MERSSTRVSSTDRTSIDVSTGDAAFASDRNGRIVFWNEAAEHLLGYRRDEVLGRACHAVLCGVDVFGNHVCTENCVLRHMAHRAEPPHRCEIEVRRADGQRLHVDLSIVTVSGGPAGEWWMIHILHMLTPAEEVAGLIGRLLHDGTPVAPPTSATAAGNGHTPSLTARELAVLRRMAEGAATEAIASDLGIRTSTVRTHVQSILHKLHVHSRAGAVARAVRDHLL